MNFVFQEAGGWLGGDTTTPGLTHRGQGRQAASSCALRGPGTQAWTFLICASTRMLLLCWITWNVEEQEPKERAEAVSGVQMGGG